MKRLRWQYEKASVRYVTFVPVRKWRDDGATKRMVETGEVIERVLTITPEAGVGSNKFDSFTVAWLGKSVEYTAPTLRQAKRRARAMAVYMDRVPGRSVLISEVPRTDRVPGFSCEPTFTTVAPSVGDGIVTLNYGGVYATAHVRADDKPADIVQRLVAEIEAKRAGATS